MGSYSSGKVFVSKDLTQWESAPSLGSNVAIYSLAYNDGLFVAAGGNSPIYPLSNRGRIYASVDGLTWNQVAVDFPVPLTGVAAYGNGFVAVGGSPFAAGYVYVSADGVNWEEEPAAIIRDSLWGVAAVNGELMVVGDNGAILRSAGERYPQIVEQPRRTAAMPGGEAVFSVEAMGEEPLAFQWYRDGEPVLDGVRISGAATAVLRLEDVTEADGGIYHVAVASGDRAVTSFAVSLVVTPYFTVNSMAGPATPGWGRTVFKEGLTRWGVRRWRCG